MKNRKTKYIFAILIIPIIVFIIELWIENESQGFYQDYIRNIVMFELPVFKIPIIGIIFFGAVIYLYYQSEIKSLNDKHDELVKEFKNEINHLKDNNSNLQKQLDDSARIMWRNYEKIMKIKDVEVLNNVIQKFVNNNEYIYGVQLYSYNKKINDKQVTIKINYKTGYVGDNINLNGMIQTCYRFNTDIYNSFKNNVLKNKDTDIETKTKYISKFITKCINPILSKQDKNINNKDANHYALALLATQILYSNINDINDIKILGKANIKKENKLINEYRTGILRGIINQSIYLFKHNSKRNNKHDRFYVSIPLSFLEEKCIFIITLNNEILNQEDHIDYITSINDLLINNLEIELERKYNINKESYLIGG